VIGYCTTCRAEAVTPRGSRTLPSCACGGDTVAVHLLRRRGVLVACPFCGVLTWPDTLFEGRCYDCHPDSPLKLRIGEPPDPSAPVQSERARIEGEFARLAVKGAGRGIKNRITYFHELNALADALDREEEK